MKFLITIILAALMAVLPAMNSLAQSTGTNAPITVAPKDGSSTNSPTPTPNFGAAGGILVLVVLAAAGWAIYKVKSTIPSDNRPVTFVLERSYDHGTWTPIFTNTITLNGTNAIEFFREQMTDQMAFYRAHKL